MGRELHSMALVQKNKVPGRPRLVLTSAVHGPQIELELAP
jgi:hypothetical protein